MSQTFLPQRNYILRLTAIHAKTNIKMIEPKISMGQDHTHTYSRRTDTNNELHNTLYRPEQV